MGNHYLLVVGLGRGGKSFPVGADPRTRTFGGGPEARDRGAEHHALHLRGSQQPARRFRPSTGRILDRRRGAAHEHRPRCDRVAHDARSSRRRRGSPRAGFLPGPHERDSWSIQPPPRIPARWRSGVAVVGVGSDTEFRSGHRSRCDGRTDAFVRVHRVRRASTPRRTDPFGAMDRVHRLVPEHHR